MNHLALEFLNVTQSAAIASKPWIGRGRKNEADDAATSAMREMLRRMKMSGIVVIGEGEMDEAPMLYIGEQLGSGEEPRLDIAVDPLEGTNLVAGGLSNSCAVIAAAPHGCLLHAPDMYMEKLAVGRRAAGSIDLELPLIDNVRRTAEALGKPLYDMTVMVQYRERHEEIIEAVRNAGARIRLFDDGDVTCAISAAMEGSGVDLFYGIGGAPEGVISAVAIKCMDGDMQARLLPGDESEYKRCIGMGLSDPGQRLMLHDMVRSEDCLFAATGITSGMLLDGVITEADGTLVTHSLLTYGNPRGVHFVHTVHSHNKAG